MRTESGGMISDSLFCCPVMPGLVHLKEPFDFLTGSLHSVLPNSTQLYMYLQGEETLHIISLLYTLVK